MSRQLSRLRLNVSEDDKTKHEQALGYGFLNFVDSLTEDTRKPRPFFTLTSDVAVNALVECVEDEWKLPRPQVFISVTGGALDFAVSNRLKEAFQRGLMAAVEKANGFIVTGGTNGEIAKSATAV